MFFYEGYSCPVCKKAFDERDDIVVCPDCGAPHHRECWRQEGHCHYEDRHGTDQEWSREKYAAEQSKKQQSTAEPFSESGSSHPQHCPRCGQPNSEFAEFCSRCGQDLDAEDWVSGSYQAPPASEPGPMPPFDGGYREYRPFQAPPPPQNPVADDTDLDGIPAGEFSQFVGQNAHYYLPRFLKIAKNDSSIGWNWSAFLLTPYWLWYRKQYLAGTLTALFQLISTAITALFVYGYLGISAGSTYESIADAILPLMNDPATSRWMMVLNLLMFLELLIRVIFGLFGNYFYYRLAHRRIHRWNENASLTPLSAVGGASVLIGAASYLVCYFLSTLINLLFI